MMNRSLIPGLAFFAGGVLIMLGPHILLPVCGGTVPTATGGIVPMKCFWTAKAEIGVGALLVLGGLAYGLLRDPGARLGIAIMATAASLLGMALPTALIGMCGSEQMACRMGTQPFLLLVGGVTGLIGGLASWSLYRAARAGKRP